MLVAISTGVRPSPPARSRAKSISTRPRKDDQREPRVGLGMDEPHENRDDADHDQAEQRDHEDALETAQVEPRRVDDRRQGEHAQTRRQRRVDDDVGPEGANVLPDNRRDPDAFAERERVEEQQRERLVSPRRVRSKRARSSPTIIATKPMPGARSLEEPCRQRRDAKPERGDAEHLGQQRMRRDGGDQRPSDGSCG